MKEIGLLILRWVFGLLSSPITEDLSRCRLARSLIDPLDYELRDLRERIGGLED